MLCTCVAAMRQGRSWVPLSQQEQCVARPGLERAPDATAGQPQPSLLVLPQPAPCSLPARGLRWGRAPVGEVAAELRSVLVCGQTYPGTSSANRNGRYFYNIPWRELGLLGLLISSALTNFLSSAVIPTAELFNCTPYGEVLIKFSD